MPNHELLATLLIVANELSHVQDWMSQAFYPVLFFLLVVASLGAPLPEDIPLIAAGVLIKTSPGLASWHGTFIVALVGIMVGDLILYQLGRRWGPGAVSHRYIRWIVTPDRFTRLSQRFARWGALFCFFGRFLMGVRAAMCVTAGATGFPYWRFFLADFAGALLSVPLFVFLGWWFAGMVDQLQAVLGDAKAIALVAILIVGGVMYGFYRRRKRAHVVAGGLPAAAGVEPRPPRSHPERPLSARRPEVQAQE